MLRIPHCLDNRLTDGGKVSALPTHRILLHRNIIYVSGSHFCYRLSKLQDLVQPELLGKFKKNSPHRVSNSRPSGL
jgi:hypothetical protein